MTTFLREHRRYVLVFILIAMTVPLAFYGVGNFGTGQDQTQTLEFVGKVGDIPISAQAFREQYDAMSRMKTQQGMEANAQDLLADGTVDQIMTYLKNDALVQIETQKRGRKATQDLLVEKLKETPAFQNDDGTFNAAYWNQMVESDAVRNWDAVYAELNGRVNRAQVLEVMGASARVSESDLRDGFKKSKTKMKVRFAAIEPHVELSEEQIRAQYDAHLDSYMTEEQRQAEFVAISLQAERPAILDDIIAKAHLGEDFGELAKQYSEAPSKATGGDIGWVVETANIQDFRKPLFNMAVGDISNAIEGPMGWYVYKVDEDRTNTLAGKRDVKTREIMVRPKLSDEEKESRLARARKIAEGAKATSDVKAAAEAEGLTVQTTDPFAASSELTGVDPLDATAFRAPLMTLEKGAVADIIEARKNVYVAKVIDVIPSVQKTFEEARADVERDALALHKQTPEYLAAIQQYVKDIKDPGTKGLDEIKEKFPELNLEIKESKLFGQTDFLFSDGIFWQPRDAFALLGDASIGAMDGPITDFSNVTHFLELTEKEEPAETIWETDWPAEKDKLVDQALAMARAERQEDYLQYLREQAQSKFLIQEDVAAISTLLGLDDPEAPAEDALPITDSAEAIVDTDTESDASLPVTVDTAGDVAVTTPASDALVPEATKPETTKPEAPKPEAPKPETTKPEAPKPEAPKPETTKPEAPTTGSPAQPPSE